MSTSFATAMLPLGSLGIDNNVKTLSHRMLLLSICVFGSLVYWSYCAILVSLLTVSNNPLTVNRLEDMLDNNQFTLIYQEGTVAYNYFSKANYDTNEAAVRIFEEYRMDVDNGNYLE